MPVTPLEQQVSAFKARMKSAPKIQESSVSLSEESDYEAPHRPKTAVDYNQTLQSSPTRNIQSAGPPIIPATMKRKTRRPSLQVSVLRPDSQENKK